MTFGYSFLFADSFFFFFFTAVQLYLKWFSYFWWNIKLISFIVSESTKSIKWFFLNISLL